MIAFRVLALLLGFVALASGVEAPQLLLHDIGPFRWIGRSEDAERGYTGILTGSGRLGNSEDRTRRTSYADRSREFFVDVVISSYADSTWVLHELEARYRSITGGFSGRVSVVEEPLRRRLQFVADSRVGPGGSIAWLSGESTLVRIQFDVAGADQPPMIPAEIVEAYLALYPSSLPTSVADTSEENARWLRDEMRRLLEYAPRDLGFARIVPTDPTQAYRRDFWRDQLIRWLTEFAELRERFYGVGDADALKDELLRAQLTDINPDTQKLDLDKYLDRLEAKLTEFQAWWAAHQNDPVQLPTPEAAPATSPSPAPTP
jgi:hypothetical protein